MTSVAGVITFTLLSLHAPGGVAPDFDDGIALGIGGLVGGYTGARLQSRKQHPQARMLASRQYVDWRELRFEAFETPVVRKALEQLALRIRATYS